MKYFFSISLFIFILFSSHIVFAQYDIEGYHFEDSLARTQTAIVGRGSHQAIFDAPQDTTYIYHLVAEGENITSILNMYQLCSPCFAEWNNYTYSNVKNLRKKKLYEGEYLKVALRKEYYNGFIAKPFTKYEYITLKKRLSVYNIGRRYGVSTQKIKEWNKFDEYTYNIAVGTEIIIDKKIYKYTCPCKDKK